MRYWAQRRSIARPKRLPARLPIDAERRIQQRTLAHLSKRIKDDPEIGGKCLQRIQELIAEEYIK